MVGQGAAPAGVLDLRTARTRAAPGLRPAATTGCLPGAWLTDGRALRGQRKARPAPEGRRCDGAPRGARALEREYGTERTMVAPLGAPSPSIGGDGGEGTTAYPAPQRTRARARACMTPRGCLTMNPKGCRPMHDQPMAHYSGKPLNDRDLLPAMVMTQNTF